MTVERHRSRRWRRALLLALVLGLGTLSACSGLIVPTDPASEAPSPSRAVTGGAASPTAPATASGPASASASSSAGSSDDLGPVVARRTVDVTATRYEPTKDYPAQVTIQLYPLRTDGKVVQLNFALTLSRTPGEWDTGDTFGDHDITDTSFGGVKLYDTTHAKVFFAGRDGDGYCLCSGRTALDSGQTQLFTVAFAAPPAGVGAMTVAIPLFGSFGRVPIV